MDFILYLCEVDSKESHKICRHAEFIKSFETCPLLRIGISPDLPTCLLNKDLHPESKTDWPFFSSRISRSCLLSSDIEVAVCFEWVLV